MFTLIQNLKTLQETKRGSPGEHQLYLEVISQLTPYIHQQIEENNLLSFSEDLSQDCHLRIIELLNERKCWVSVLRREIQRIIAKEANQEELIPLDEICVNIVQFEEPWKLTRNEVFKQQDKWLFKHLSVQEKLILFLKYVWGLQDKEIAYNFNLSIYEFYSKIEQTMNKLSYHATTYKTKNGVQKYVI